MTNARVARTSTEDISTGLNLFFSCFYVLVNLFQFVILPCWLLAVDLRWRFTLLPLALLTNPFWSLIHEAIHDLLHPNRRINALIGRLLSVMFGSPFAVLRSSHLLHHKLNRAPIEGTEFYERGKSSIAVAAIGYYFQILGGLYLVEIVTPLLFFIPQTVIKSFKDRVIRRQTITGILLRHWTQDESLKAIRIDGALVVLWFALGFFCYGSYWPLLLLAFAARGFLISFLDNVYHYRTPVNDIFYACNLWLPKLLAKPLLNFNLHGIHHRNPSIPWKRLPVAFQQQAQIYHGTYFTAAVRQLAGSAALHNLPWAGSRQHLSERKSVIAQCHSDPYRSRERLRPFPTDPPKNGSARNDV